MARVELRADLNHVVAGMAANVVNRLAGQVVREAALRAPAAKLWLSRDDMRVRPAHVEAHGQTIPANLRYKLPKQVYVRGQGTVLVEGAFDLARKPRDPALPADQVVNCRCVNVSLPGVIARRIRATPAVVERARARAQVSVRFPRIVESHHGTSEDQAARFLGDAVDVVAARLRASARRT